MSADYRLLRQWLHLEPEGPWPPPAWELLGLSLGAASAASVSLDPRAIEGRVLERLDWLRPYQLKYPELVTEGMNRLAQAFLELTQRSGGEKPAPTASSASSASSAPAAGPAFPAEGEAESDWPDMGADTLFEVPESASFPAAPPFSSAEAGPVPVAAPVSPPSFPAGNGAESRPPPLPMAEGPAGVAPATPGRPDMPQSAPSSAGGPLPPPLPTPPYPLAPLPPSLPTPPYPLAPLPPPPLPAVPPLAREAERLADRQRRRALYRRLVQLRRLRRAWEEVGEILANAPLLDNPLSLLRFHAVHRRLRASLSHLKDLWPMAGPVDGAQAAALLRQEQAVPILRELEPEQRLRFLLDWRRGERHLAGLYQQLWEQLQKERQARHRRRLGTRLLGRLLRFLTWPETVLVLALLLALCVLSLRGG